MIDQIRRFIDEHDLLRPEDLCIVALSGGADSLCLLEILYRLGVSLTAVHVQHHLRESAERDAAFAEAFCRERNIPFVRKDVDVETHRERTGESTEEAARVLRYAALNEERIRLSAEGRNVVIALAHHRNDQAETVLFHLIRGSGVRGLAGMRPKQGPYIRPLLGVTRQEIEVWLEKEGIAFCVDETNEDTEITRNRIRQHVIPELAEIRPDAVEKITEAAAQLAETEDFLEGEAAAWLSAHEGEEIPAELTGVHPVLQCAVIRKKMRLMGCPLRDVGREHVESVRGLFEKPVGKQVPLPGGTLALRTYTGVKLMPGARRLLAHGEEVSCTGSVTTPAERATECGSLPAGVSLNGARLISRVFPYAKDGKFPEKECTKWFDYDKIKGNISFRKRRPGDVFSTSRGTRKKLSDWMIDEKIPRALRNEILVVADEEEVLWVPGYRMGESRKITDETETVLELTVTTDSDR